MNQKVKTFDTVGFMDSFIDPLLKRKSAVKKNYGRFLITPVQEMLKASKLPVPPTRSTSHTLVFLTEGKASMKIGFHPIHLNAPECMFVAAGQVFSYDKYDVNQGYILVFEPAFLHEAGIGNTFLKKLEFLNTWGNPVIKPKPETATYITQTLERIYCEYRENGLLNEPILQAYLIAALTDLNQAYQPLLKHKSKTAIALTNKFKELIHQHIQSLHNVSDYAKLLNVTPNHLNKTVKQASGKPASRWIEEALILEAKVLLFQTTLPVNTIADQLGVLDPSYFSRLFKKVEGVSPTAYRKMIDKS